MRLRFLVIPDGGQLLIVDRCTADQAEALAAWLTPMSQEEQVAQHGARFVLIFGADLGDVELGDAVGPSEAVLQAVRDQLPPAPEVEVA